MSLGCVTHVLGLKCYPCFWVGPFWSHDSGETADFEVGFFLREKIEFTVLGGNLWQ